MTLTRWQPRRRFGLVPEIDRFFDSFWRGPQHDLPVLSTWSPATDVQETDTDLLVHVELPGLSKKDIKVNMDNGVLAIQGEKSHVAEEKENRFHVSERTYGRFARSFTLPAEVNAEKIKAGFENGVLTLTLPKVKATTSKAIEIA